MFIAKHIRKLNTNERILFVLTVASILSFIVFYAVYLINTKQMKLVRTTYEVQFQESAEAAIQSKNEALNQVVFDYTYWDEMIRQIESSDTKWFNDNVFTLIESFKIDFVGIYNLNEAVVGLHFSDQVKSRNAKLVPPDIFPDLYKKRFCNYFIETPDGLMQVSGATVHGSDDPGRKKPPQGYMFIAKLWTNEFLGQLQRMTNAEAKLVASNSTMVHDDNKTIHSTFQLKDYQDTPIISLYLTKSVEWIEEFRNQSLLTMLIYVVTAIFFILVFYQASRIWVGKPLKAVRQILQDEDDTQIEHLKKLHTEFREIGILFQSFVNQKKELTAAKIKAEESDQLKSAFLANMSHEIRTPMNGILGFAELLKDEAITLESRREYLDIITKSGRHLLSVINDIIDISKIEAGLMTIEKRRCDLNQVFSDVFLFFKKHQDVGRKKLDLKLKLQLSNEASICHSDPNRLAQILHNLIGNAVKFTQTGSIEVGYKLADANSILIYVSDTGIGIPKDKLVRIFERFIQADNTNARKFEGTGLGLAISKALVELLGGSIWVESELNKGSIFYVRLPFIQVESNGVEIKEVEVDDYIPDFKGKTVLVTEDVDENYKFFSALLAKTNASVLWAKNGREAVDLVDSQIKIDIILMDLRMPVMNGYEATRAIKRKRKDIPIIAQTAYSLDGDRTKSMEAGCDEYIAKPIEIQQLYRMMEQFLKPAS